MATKVLGQSAPAATTNTDLYTVPSAKTAVCSSLVVCNRSSTPATYNVAVRPAGATLANQHYLVNTLTLAANATDVWTIGITLATTDVVTVQASTANLSFSLFGDES